MRYSHWVAILTVINIAIIISIAWSTYTFMTMLFAAGGFLEQPNFTAQPFMFITCILLSVLNTPLLAAPIVKYPESMKTTIIYCIVLPFALMIISCVIAIFASLPT